MNILLAFTMTNIDAQDAQFFKDNDISVGMEDCGGFYALYGELDMEDEDGEPIEAIHTTRRGETCHEAMKALRSECEQLLRGFGKC